MQAWFMRRAILLGFLLLLQLKNRPGLQKSAQSINLKIGSYHMALVELLQLGACWDASFFISCLIGPMCCYFSFDQNRLQTSLAFCRPGALFLPRNKIRQTSSSRFQDPSEPKIPDQLVFAQGFSSGFWPPISTVGYSTTEFGSRARRQTHTCQKSRVSLLLPHNRLVAALSWSYTTLSGSHISYAVQHQYRKQRVRKTEEVLLGLQRLIFMRTVVKKVVLSGSGFPVEHVTE